jgi:YebC/PmpR family DNA-binding regulatory protein
MAGHSKWANIKHRKGRQDKKKGKLFSKLSKMITSAAREGGGDSDMNPNLAMAVDKAKDANMPKDNIERAIKKGTGELEGKDYKTDRLEAYGPGGVAIMINIVTDNRNRTLSDLKGIIRDYEGSLADKGSVAWKFEKRGKMLIEAKDEAERDRLLEPIIDFGATDYEEFEDGLIVYTKPSGLHAVKRKLEQNKIKPKEVEFSWEPKIEVKIGDKKVAKRILKLMTDLEEHDDVESVFADFDINDDILENI